MKNIIVSAISFVNTEKQGSEIYTTFAKRLINDVLTKTPYDVMVTTNRSDLFDDVSSLERVTIVHNILENHKTHVGAFNQLLKFTAIKDIPKKYDWVFYLDCDAGFTEPLDPQVVDNFISSAENEGYDMLALRTDATYDYSKKEFNETTDFTYVKHSKPLFNDKFLFYGEHPEWGGAKFPSEHILLMKNNEKLQTMSYEFEKLCTQFETQDPNKIITFDMEAFEIGISAHLSGYNIKELGWGNQNSVLKVGFNFNNWEKVKI